MKTYMYLFQFFILIIINSCQKNEFESINWQELKTGIINMEEVVINHELSKLLDYTIPTPTETDPTGHYKNFQNFVKHLNQSEILKADSFCYTCIKTYPAITELFIETDSLNIKVVRVLDILTPENRKLEFSGIHN